jgi:uncharacterized membrane-anchored protein YhcB (DUF1043 family)
MTITFSEIAPAAVVVSIMVGALFWLWNRIYRVEVDASKEVKGLRDDFQSYKLHVAETYVPNIAMRDMKDEIMGAVKDLKADLKGSLDHMGDRIDRLSQERVKAKRPASRLGE